MQRPSSFGAANQLGLTFVGEEEAEGIVSNLSLAGCTIRSKTSAPAGSFLRIVIHRSNEPITIPMAVVRWSTPYQFGVDFLILPAQERAKLTELVWAFRDDAFASEELV
ncbi:MAG: hypothetical protein C4293_06435 [Nitrospiraceae bacterium]